MSEKKLPVRAEDLLPAYAGTLVEFLVRDENGVPQTHKENVFLKINSSYEKEKQSLVEKKIKGVNKL